MLTTTILTLVNSYRIDKNKNGYEGLAGFIASFVTQLPPRRFPAPRGFFMKGGIPTGNPSRFSQKGARA
jgi:hypothetical protein